MTYSAWFAFLGAALLEAGGDAIIRRGLRGNGTLVIFLGIAILGCYGIVVNAVRWDFSELTTWSIRSGLCARQRPVRKTFL